MHILCIRYREICKISVETLTAYEPLGYNLIMKTKEILQIVAISLAVLIIGSIFGLWAITAYFLGPFLMMALVYFASKTIIAVSSNPKLSALWLKILLPLPSAIGYIYGTTAMIRSVSDFPILPLNQVFRYLMDFNSNMVNLPVGNILIVIIVMYLILLPFIFLAQKHVNRATLTLASRNAWQRSSIILVILATVIWWLNNAGGWFGFFASIFIIPVAIIVVIVAAVIDFRSK